jgi:ABC-type uncharacterized transport system fused permease/ATPase subunit
MVRENIAFLRAALRVATLDDLALARHRRAHAHCWASRATRWQLDAGGAPVAGQCHALDFGMAQQGVFISGQNGVGKSTLLRAWASTW